MIPLPASSQRLWGLLLLGTEAAALALLSRTFLFPLAIILIATAGWLLPLQIDVSRRAAFYLTVALVVCFLVKAAVFPHQFPRATVFYGTAFTHSLAQLFIAWQAGCFFISGRGERLPLLFPMLGAVALLAMANVVVHSPRRELLQALVIAYVILSGIFFSVGRPVAVGGAHRSTARTAALWTVSAVVAVVATTSAYALERFEGDIERFVNRLLVSFSPVVEPGYSGWAELGDVAFRKRGGGERVALRIESDEPPGYLRGRVFDLYARGIWRANPMDRRADPVPLALQGGIPTLPPGMNLFQFRQASAGGGWRRITIWASPHSGAIFVPLGTTHLQVPADWLLVNPHGMFSLREGIAPTSYVAIGPRGSVAAVHDDAAGARALLMLPRRFRDPEHPVAKFAAKLFEGAADSAEKIRRVESYFHNNYKYDLEVKVPRDRDPLEWFLLDRPAAHCEYFASGAAILLRLGNVPCRYVTGFVVRERNDYGGYWIGRDRDAHAWVEAWIPGRGWTVVEATPADGVPSERAAGGLHQLWEAIRGQARMIWSELRRDGLQASLERLWNAVIAMPSLLVTFGAAGIVWLAVRVRRRRRRRRPLDPAIRGLHRLRRRVDARLRRAAFVRRPEETLHHFVERILADPEAASDNSLRSAAEWYRRYADVRYSGQYTAERIASLAKSLPK